METEFARCMDAMAVLDRCGIPRKQITAEKTAIYGQLAELNHQIRAERKKLALCRENHKDLPQTDSRRQSVPTKHKSRRSKVPE